MLNVFNRARKKTEGIFFGWWIVISGCVIQGLNSGLLGQGFTLYFLSLQEEFGWTRTLLSTGFSLSNIVNGIFSPFIGWLTDRFGPRRMVLIGNAMLGGGFICLSSVHSIVTFFLSFVLIAGGASLSGYLPISVVVLNWFVRKRSIALGIASSGMGLGGFIVPVVAWSIANHGWRTTAMGSGIVILVLGTVAALFLRQRPEKYGYLPDGDSPDKNDRDSDSGAPVIIPKADDFSLQEAMKTRAFWLIAAGHAMAVLTIAAVVLHLAPHLVQRLGMSLETAGSIASLVLFISIAGRLLGGYIGDRIDNRWILVGSMIFHTIGLLLLANATNMFMVILFAIFHGLAWGARGLVQNSIRADYFGRKAIGAILGVASVPVVVSQVVSPIFTAWLADLNGDYHFAFMLLAGYTAAGSLLFAFAKKPVKKQPGQVT